MNLRALSVFGAVSAFVVPFLVSATASAQEPDGVRFRGGIGLEAGPLIITHVGGLGVVGLQGQLGVQINNNWAVYAVPSLDIAFGGGGTGLAVGGAVLGEYTFTGIPISVGAGLSAGQFAVFGDGTAFGSAPYYGARLHGAWYPVMNRGWNGIRRRALFVALDVNIEGFPQAGESPIIFSPVVSVGYQAF
jgi:hypothetical protein